MQLMEWIIENICKRDWVHQRKSLESGTGNYTVLQNSWLFTYYLPCSKQFLLFLLLDIRQACGTQIPKVVIIVQSLSHVWLFATPWTAARQASLSFTNSWSLLKFMSIELVMPSNHLILYDLLLLLPLILPSIRFFSNDSVLHIRWPEYWSFSFSISPSNEYSGLISFWIDCFDFLAVQGTLKSLLQYHSSEASTLRCSAFFMVQLFTSIHVYYIALTGQTFVGKVMSLLLHSCLCWS